MTPRLMDVGRRWHARVRNFFDAAPDATASPLELLQAALDQLERKAQPSGRGSRIFPYNRVVVHVAQPDADRATIEAVFAQLHTRLREHGLDRRPIGVRHASPSTRASHRTAPCCGSSAAAMETVPRERPWTASCPS